MPNLLPFKWNIALTLVFTVVKFHSEPLYLSAANYVTRVEYTLDFMDNQTSFHFSIQEMSYLPPMIHSIVYLAYVLVLLRCNNELHHLSMILKKF